MVALGFPPLHAFRDFVLNQIPDMFPKLRFGFIEASASWIPLLDPQVAARQHQTLESIVESPADLSKTAVSLSPAKPTKILPI